MNDRTAQSGFPAAAIAAGLLLAAMLLGGCHHGPPVVSDPTASLPQGESSAAFLDRLSDQNTVSQNDAMRGIILMLEGRDEFRSFQQRIDHLLGRGIIDPGWSFDADKPVTRGQLAYMAYQAGEFTGGLILTLTGPSQRYCLREMQYRNVMIDGAFYSAVDGMEFIAVLRRVDVFRRTGKVPQPSGTVNKL